LGIVYVQTQKTRAREAMTAKRTELTRPKAFEHWRLLLKRSMVAVATELPQMVYLEEFEMQVLAWEAQTSV